MQTKPKFDVKTFICDAGELCNSLERFRGDLSRIAALAAANGDEDCMRLLNRLAAIDEGLRLADTVMRSQAITLLHALNRLQDHNL